MPRDGGDAERGDERRPEPDDRRAGEQRVQAVAAASSLTGQHGLEAEWRYRRGEVEERVGEGVTADTLGSQLPGEHEHKGRREHRHPEPHDEERRRVPQNGQAPTSQRPSPGEQPLDAAALDASALHADACSLHMVRSTMAQPSRPPRAKPRNIHMPSPPSTLMRGKASGSETTRTAPCCDVNSSSYPTSCSIWRVVALKSRRVPKGYANAVTGTPSRSSSVLRERSPWVRISAGDKPPSDSWVQACDPTLIPALLTACNSFQETRRSRSPAGRVPTSPAGTNATAGTP